MADRLTGMGMFVTVVETGSFSAAAIKLGLTKSAVSKQVMLLEESLSVKLLHRTTRTLSLTDEGAEFYGRATRILEEVKDAEHSLSSRHAEPRGTLKVSSPVSFGTLHLSRMLPSFIVAHRHVRLELELNDRRVDVVEEGIDVALRIAREVRDKTVIARPVTAIGLVMCASEEYLFRHGTPTHPEDLANHNCLEYGHAEAESLWHLSSGFVPVKGTLLANNGEVLLGMAKAGAGIALLPRYIVGGAIADGSLKEIMAEYTPAPLTLFAVTPQEPFLPRKTAAFLDFLGSQFGESPGWSQ